MGIFGDWLQELERLAEKHHGCPVTTNWSHNRRATWRWVLNLERARDGRHLYTSHSMESGIEPIQVALEHYRRLMNGT